MLPERLRLQIDGAARFVLDREGRVFAWIGRPWRIGRLGIKKKPIEGNLSDRCLRCFGCVEDAFTHSGAAGGKYRTVPERYLFVRDLVLTEAQWESLQIPVSIAFFFHNSTLGHSTAFYPSPAGATESLLPLGTWEELTATNPLLASLEPDVEALLVYKRSDGFECYVVPIDACYELVGRIRLRWKGFQGGEEAWTAIDAFFAGVRGKSREPSEGQRWPT